MSESECMHERPRRKTHTFASGGGGALPFLLLLPCHRALRLESLHLVKVQLFALQKNRGVRRRNQYHHQASICCFTAAAPSTYTKAHTPTRKTNRVHTSMHICTTHTHNTNHTGTYAHSAQTHFTHTRAQAVTPTCKAPAFDCFQR